MASGEGRGGGKGRGLLRDGKNGGIGKGGETRRVRVKGVGREK